MALVGYGDETAFLELSVESTPLPVERVERLDDGFGEIRIEPVRHAVGCSREGLRTIEDSQVIPTPDPTRQDLVDHDVRDRGGVVVTLEDAEHRVVVSSRECRLEVLIRYQPELRLKEDGGSFETAVRGGGREGQSPASELRDRPDSALAMSEDLHLVPEGPVGPGHHRGGHESGAVYGQRDTPRVEPRDMESPGPHGFDLCRVRLHGEEEYVPRHGLLEVGEKSCPDAPELGWIFHRRVGEDQPVGIEKHA